MFEKRLRLFSEGRFKLSGTKPVNPLELKSRASKFVRLKIDGGMEPEMKLRERLRTLR